MPKRKTLNETSLPRYASKMRRFLSGVVSPEEASKISERAAIEWTKKYYEYRNAYEAIKPVLAAHGVNKALYGLYRSAALEYMNKVANQKITEITWYQKWLDQGCDVHVLEAMADVLASKMLEKAGGGKVATTIM